MATTVSTILTNKTLTTLVQTRLFLGLPRILAMSKGVLMLPYSIGFVTIILNSIQLWLLAKKFRRDANSLLVVIKHLCISDLLNGVFSSLVPPTLGLIETKMLPGNNIILFITKASARFGVRYVFAVSTVLLCLLTVIKMLKIVHNRSYTRLGLRNSCRSVWFVTFVLVGIEFAIAETDILTTLSVTTLNRIWMLMVMFPSIFLQCFCYWRIFTAVREVNTRAPPRADGSTRNDSSWQKIAVFQLLVFIVCVSPVSFYLLLVAIRGIKNLSKTGKLTLAMLVVFNNLNSMIDPIVFFVVFRRKWKRRRIASAVRFNGREIVIAENN